MCWQCDHPDSSYEDYLEHLRDLMKCHGWIIQGVGGDRIHPPWAYTVGLTEFGEPELVVTGMREVPSAELLNNMAAHVLHAAAPRPGEQIPLTGGPLVEIVEVAEPSAHLRVAADFYGPGIRALQFVHADDRGHWPWDTGWRGIRGGQPVLGPRQPVQTRVA
jgi:hypothetical protein